MLVLGFSYFIYVVVAIFIYRELKNLKSERLAIAWLILRLAGVERRLEPIRK